MASTVDDALDRIEHDGWVILHDVVPAALVAELGDAVDRTIDRLGTGCSTTTCSCRR